MRRYSTTDDGNALIGGRAVETLALGFVEDDGGGDGGVEGFDGAGHRNGEGGVGGASNFGRKAGAFVADEEGEGGAEVGSAGGRRGGGGGGGFGGGGDEGEASGAELSEGDGGREAAQEGDTEGGSGGGTHGFGGPGIGGAFGGDHPGGAEGFGGANGGADVARILNAEEGDDEGDAAGEIVESVFAGLDEGGDALRVFGAGDLIEEFFGGAEEFEFFAVGGRQCVKEFVGGGAGEDGDDLGAGVEGFFDEVRTLDGDKIFGGKVAVAKGGAEEFEVLVIAGGDELRCGARVGGGAGTARRRGAREFVGG